MMKGFEPRAPSVQSDNPTNLATVTTLCTFEFSRNLAYMMKLSAWDQEAKLSNASSCDEDQ